MTDDDKRDGERQQKTTTQKKQRRQAEDYKNNEGMIAVKILEHPRPPGESDMGGGFVFAEHLMAAHAAISFRRCYDCLRVRCNVLF